MASAQKISSEVSARVDIYRCVMDAESCSQGGTVACKAIAGKAMRPYTTGAKMTVDCHGRTPCDSHLYTCSCIAPPARLRPVARPLRARQVEGPKVSAPQQESIRELSEISAMAHGQRPHLESSTSSPCSNPCICKVHPFYAQLLPCVKEGNGVSPAPTHTAFAPRLLYDYLRAGRLAQVKGKTPLLDPQPSSFPSVAPSRGSPGRPHPGENPSPLPSARRQLSRNLPTSLSSPPTQQPTPTRWPYPKEGPSP